MNVISNYRLLVVFHKVKGGVTRSGCRWTPLILWFSLFVFFLFSSPSSLLFLLFTGDVSEGNEPHHNSNNKRTERRGEGRTEANKPKGGEQRELNPGLAVNKVNRVLTVMTVTPGWTNLLNLRNWTVSEGNKLNQGKWPVQMLTVQSFHPAVSLVFHSVLLTHLTAVPLLYLLFLGLLTLFAFGNSRNSRRMKDTNVRWVNWMKLLDRGTRCCGWTGL